MGRFLDFVILFVAIISVFIMQFASGAILVPLSDSVQDDGVSSKYNAGDNFDDMIEAVTVWVPTIGLGGLILVIAFREYRRQRIAGTRGVRR